MERLAVRMIIGITAHRSGIENLSIFSTLAVWLRRSEFRANYCDQHCEAVSQPCPGDPPGRRFA